MIRIMHSLMQSQSREYLVSMGRYQALLLCLHQLWWYYV